MSLSDSTFLLDISVEQIKGLDRKEFRCQVNCADLVKSYLLDLKEFDYAVKTRPIRREKSKKKRVLCYRGLRKEFGQTLILINKDNQILLNMEKHNLELSLWSKSHPDVKIGTSIIPWTQNVYNYFKNISESPRLPPIVNKGVYNVANTQQNRLGSITITIKLVCTSSNFYRYISRSKNNVSIYGHLFSNPDVIFNLFHTIKRNNATKADAYEIQKNKLELENGILESIKHDTKQSVVETYKANMLKEYDFIKDPKINSSFVNTRRMFKQYECNKIINEKKHNAFDYIFGDPKECFKYRVYCVNYFTVNINKSSRSDTSIKSSAQNKRLNFRKGNSQYLHETKSDANITITHSLDGPPDVTSSFKLIKCKEISCDSRVHHKPPIFTNTTTALDFTNIHKECCKNQEYKGKTEEVLGEVSAKINDGEDQCYCSCECRFGFTKQTRYCKVCGGYEIAGDDLMNKIALDMPMPCPIFHKLVDKNRLKTWSTSGSESRSKVSKVKGDDSLKSIKSSTKAASNKRLPVSDKKNVKSEKDSKKENNEIHNTQIIKRHRMQFTYAYKAPHIGHHHCLLPCTGTQNNVPKSMGWFWTADDSPGSRFRPKWKPGAINKQVHRSLRVAKNVEEVFGKKKKKDVGKSKRLLKRPLLTVHKIDGEYTVTMETMKVYTKPRAIHQQPYEDKPVLIYTIGRTEEENRQRQKKKYREQRRLEREQRIYLQSAFKNMCHEICMKTYQQALGILPNAEDDDCPCYASLPMADTTSINFSCSCSEDSRSDSETDCDEWLVEFTPPNALYRPSMKVKKTTKTDNSTQYTYLDYRVKLVDRFGNPVPRFFKGPDGKEQCSDLGGFFSPEHKWLEINVDGYIGPDGRWAPNSFIGPRGEQVDAETGKFQDKNLQWLVVGVDGYVNAQGKWRFYSKYRAAATQKKRSKHTIKKSENVPCNSETSWSCFGQVTPKQLSRLGISGHGRDKRFLLSKLKHLVDRGQNTVPQKTQKLGKKREK